MQENHRNGQDDSDIKETSELFTVTRAALNRHIISSANCSWLKQGPANQSMNCCKLNWNAARKKFLIVLWCSYRQYYRRKVNTSKLYRKIFTSEIDIQQVKLELY